MCCTIFYFKKMLLTHLNIYVRILNRNIVQKYLYSVSLTIEIQKSKLTDTYQESDQKTRTKNQIKVHFPLKFPRQNTFSFCLVVNIDL